MSSKEDLKIKYNELIKLSIKTMQIFKNGSYEFKAKEIERCKNDIEFFKSQKKKIV
jgi:hypothetical protein